MVFISENHAKQIETLSGENIVFFFIIKEHFVNYSEVAAVF
jgi:hypothetical protein